MHASDVSWWQVKYFNCIIFFLIHMSFPSLDSALKCIERSTNKTSIRPPVLEIALVICGGKINFSKLKPYVYRKKSIMK